MHGTYNVKFVMGLFPVGKAARAWL
jgi:hypothetical protein